MFSFICWFGKDIESLNQIKQLIDSAIILRVSFIAAFILFSSVKSTANFRILCQSDVTHFIDSMHLSTPSEFIRETIAIGSKVHSNSKVVSSNFRSQPSNKISFSVSQVNNRLVIGSALSNLYVQ